MQSTEAAKVDDVYGYSICQLPATNMVHYDKDFLGNALSAIEEIINGPDDNQLKQPLINAYKVIEECLSRYEPWQVCVSFTGGKDCSALLHIIYAVWQKLYSGHRLQAMYIFGTDPFAEMEQFIEDTRQRYDLELWKIGGPIRSGLASVLEQHPNIKAILMGTRRIDPHAGNLQFFQMTDEGWPPVMRVNPILDWTYQQVWTFLRQLSLPYCVLYDYGYTSIGNRNNTKPNPALRLIDADGKEVYRPAYFLHDSLTERQGRL